MVIGQGSRIRNTMSMSPACSALAKFERAAEVCFYIMFKVRCHYFIQEINLLHKKGRPKNPFCWNFEFPLTEAPTMCTCKLFWS